MHLGLVWLSSMRDLGWRKRRLAIAVVATTLAFALTLLLSGFRHGIDVEADRTVRALQADAFVVRAGVSGPFTTTAQVPAAMATTIAAQPGVRAADAIVSVRHSIESRPVTDVYLIGARPGGLGMARPIAGREPRAAGEAMLDTLTGRHIGDHVRLGGQDFVVVGLVRKTSVWAHVPAMFIMLDDAQRLIFGGAPSATAILTRGTPSAVPDDVRVVSPAQARSDLKRPLANAVRTIDLFRLILWIVAATVIGSVLYISALERSRDFAVFKAFGTDSSDLVAGLIFEALVIAAISGGAAVLAADGLTRLFPAVISVPASLLALLGIAALSAGVLGGIAGARRAVTVEPSLAFSSQ